MKSAVERIGIDPRKLENISVTEDDRRKMFAITPIEGRYEKYVSGLHNTTSEFEWVRRRVWIEAEYLISLASFIAHSKTKKTKIFKRPFSGLEQKIIRGLYQNFSEKDFLAIKKIEEVTKHDLVAVTRWMGWQLDINRIHVEEAIHFGRTTYDIDTNVYASVLRDLLYSHFFRSLVKIQNQLIKRAENWDMVFAGQTHGQWAEYTTLKKVFANFTEGIRQGIETFVKSGKKLLPAGKMAGAIGNNSDIHGAYPDLDWENFNKKFIENILMLEYSPMADQDGFNIRGNEIFDGITRINDVLSKFCEDFWEYCSRGVFIKKPKAGESGSSVMAQKANPWRIEGGWEYLSDVDFYKYHNLTKYKRQGDLRRSIRMRTIGEPFAKCIIAMERISEELELYSPNVTKIKEECEENIEMSSAYIQTVLRREGLKDAYDKIKKISMGQELTQKDYHETIDKLVKSKEITEKIAKEIKEGMIPEHNTGYANILADDALNKAKKQLKEITKWP